MLLAETYVQCVIAFGCKPFSLSCLMGERRNYMKTRSLVLMALFIVLEIVCTGILKVNVGFLRISLTFIPYAICGYLLGPVKGMLVGILADIIGFILFPQGTYFPGFTVSAALSGGLYGFLKGKTGKSLVMGLGIVTIINSIIMNVILNTVWLQMLLGKSWSVMIYERIVKNAITTPLEIIVLIAVFKGLKPIFEREKRHGSGS